MPTKIAKFESTPNPDALKCVLAAPAPPALPTPPTPPTQPASLVEPAQPGMPIARPRSYRSLQDAAADPLAQRILSVPGIAGVLILNDFITVTRAPGAPWPAIKHGVEAALASA
jgi:hypothetical protein